MKFYLQRMRKVPERPAPWTYRGISLHNAVLEWETSGRTIDLPSRALELYDEEIEKALAKYPDPRVWMTTPRTKNLQNDIKYRREDVYKQCVAYDEMCREAEWEVAVDSDGKVMCEVPFELEVSGITVKGSIDMILYWPGSDAYSVRDLKTGSERKKYYQLGVYRHASQKILGLDIDYGDYYYTKLNRSSGMIDLRRYDELYIGQLFSRAEQIISQNLFIASPGDCDMCPVKMYCPEMGNEVWDG